MSAGFLRSARQREPRDVATTLNVGGFTGLSCADYPGLLSAVVFCQGCPWRCGYCHNPHLLASRGEHAIAWQSVAAFLARRRGLLDAVVFSDGEPTLHAGLADAMHDVKRMGFRIGLHTAGIYPRRLETLLPLTDWVAMDIKAPFAAYDEVTGKPKSGENAFESLRLILESGVNYEFRTTVAPALLSAQALKELAQLLAKLGVRNYVLQEFRTQGCANAAVQDADSYLTDSYCQSIAPMFHSFAVRRAR